MSDTNTTFVAILPRCLETAIPEETRTRNIVKFLNALEECDADEKIFVIGSLEIMNRAMDDTFAERANAQAAQQFNQSLTKEELRKMTDISNGLILQVKAHNLSKKRKREQEEEQLAVRDADAEETKAKEEKEKKEHAAAKRVKKPKTKTKTKN